MDPISDILIRIKNAQKAGKPSVEVPFSKVKFELAKIFERENFVEGVEEKGKKAAKKIYINLKYKDGIPAIENITRKSRPSGRIYLGKDKIRSVRQGYGRAIISTSKGLMSDKEARKAGLGGELICEIW
ncbi:MAG: 30S ribosomal protein S8 [Candidatus Portnoybacteria bacterium CG_4_8_14_3_um_filter_40_10]|uniref:Small ribosomal subunit protein uS8 n=4 Tax=Candidatus Portnoyibacteriota TaxID=1817913 RepID=A0A2M7IJG7_9BACT|nr:MAG: 30S ribosomal protein S8 [Candidatus Portnoybacteria bacterium CG11_big_fil_rev_8_21_14_0_20_40_15]PIS31821.1 MAG: 30S ribosomal protein S8 [Candidatus Portnoybacteria bacterium CG08_land_8_20_14_0_20_40_83]PIW76680.1 MAG: 30S ribosomal protein S8 [Candidatus Portnoybacteria bacterium CG_4_8_14_3_um_filter_40_10]PIY75448.1 MAG: 30S ribosomal protein S8 [Candidatus Portnoybacteria bacterium CG_4_10_14_0_8_um_filter_40_50]PJA64454.1 MAG: 30S ribosomal protein S8 [Candidatus Portnoybacteri